MPSINAITCSCCGGTHRTTDAALNCERAFLRCREYYANIRGSDFVLMKDDPDRWHAENGGGQ